jgi:uncharacterized protein YndB with AHSA1/START domain
MWAPEARIEVKRWLEFYPRVVRPYVAHGALPADILPNNSATPSFHGELQLPSTIRLHRVLRTTPEKLYRAFLDSDAKAKWLPPYGFTCKVHRDDAKVGGTYKMSFTNFTTGDSHSFGGTYIELVPNERIRYNDQFDDPNLAGELQVTITMKKGVMGTELSIVQEGVPDVIPADACYLGWQESLKQLARLVEPDIKG